MHRVAICLTAALVLAAACTHSQVTIDWVDVVRLGGITYMAQPAAASSGQQLQPSDLGPAYGLVKVKLDGSQDPNHKLQDGDAAFLDPGTQVYRVTGYRATFRLAARHDGYLVLYEADTNPAARTGADLLDLAGKVSYIGINSATDGTTRLGAIRDSVQVERLVAMVESAPVDQSRQGSGAMGYFIDFHMVDGTDVTRAYWPDAGVLGRGIMVPAAFGAAVTSAVRSA
jgi:hypothetical protein